MLLNEKGELSKGLEILLKQLFKMLGIDGNSTIAQISSIYELLKRHIAQQDEMLAALKRIENVEHRNDGKSVPAGIRE